MHMLGHLVEIIAHLYLFVPIVICRLAKHNVYR